MDRSLHPACRWESQAAAVQVHPFRLKCCYICIQTPLSHPWATTSALLLPQLLHAILSQLQVWKHLSHSEQSLTLWGPTTDD